MVYLCEAALLTLTIIKLKHQSILNDVKDVLNHAVSNIQRRLNSLWKDEEVHSLVSVQDCFHPQQMAKLHIIISRSYSNIYYQSNSYLNAFPYDLLSINVIHIYIYFIY